MGCGVGDMSLEERVTAQQGGGAAGLSPLVEGRAVRSSIIRILTGHELRIERRLRQTDRRPVRK